MHGLTISEIYGADLKKLNKKTQITTKKKYFRGLIVWTQLLLCLEVWNAIPKY